MKSKLKALWSGCALQIFKACINTGNASQNRYSTDCLVWRLALTLNLTSRKVNIMMSCSDYDYIEIVCMYRYPIAITLASGVQLECIARDTKRDEQKRECIQVDNQGELQLIVLDELRTLEVLVDNPHFTKVTFNG